MIDSIPALPAPPAPCLAARRGFITLDEDAWAQIRSEYLAGATAKQIKDKWGCSEVSVYDHASRGGWTKRARGAAISATVLEETRAERAERAARASEAPPEASPLMAASLLLRQAAASALIGETQSALKGVQLAESLARAARLISEAEHGVEASRAELLAAAKQALEDDPDYTPPGWRDGEEARALRATIIAGLMRLRAKRGRAPPNRLPMWFMLDEDDVRRPLAEALGLVVEGRDWVECPDFEAAVARARAAGRGEAVDRALSEPLPLERCVWLSDSEKAQVTAREAAAGRLADAAAAEVASGLGWPDDEAGEPLGEWAEPDDGGPRLRGLDETDEPWRRMPRRRPGRISEG